MAVSEGVVKAVAALRWRVGVVFCGIRVGSYGFERAPNAMLVGGGDNNVDAVAHFEMNHPGAVASVVDYSREDLAVAITNSQGICHMMQISSPCQPFSWAGLQLALRCADDPLAELSVGAVRICLRLDHVPSCIWFEQVQPFYGSTAWKRVCGLLVAQGGFRLQWAMVDASSWAAARRARA